MSSFPSSTSFKRATGTSFIEPSEQDYALLGRIALNHASLEYVIESMIWGYMEDVDKGHVATSPLGSIERTNMLATLVDWTEPDDDVAEAIAFSIRSFHTLRTIRNTLLHGHNFRVSTTKDRLLLDSRGKGLVFDAWQVFDFQRSDLERIEQDQLNLLIFMGGVFNAITARPKGAIGPNLPPPVLPCALPAKPPEPQTLTRLDHITPKSARTQRRELVEKEARASKYAARERQRRDPGDRKLDR
jgi:hypothetical protein